MKKHLLKLSLLAFVMLFSASSIQAQALYTVQGSYKISTSGVTPELYMTISQSGGLEWAAELPGDDPTQVWTIQDHTMPLSAGYVQITASIPGLADFTMVADQSSIDAKNIRLTVRPGNPIIDTEDANYGFDQFQRRKAKVGADGLADSEGTNPAAGNNALFVKIPSEGGSRYGAIPTAAGEAVQFDGAGIDVLQYHLIEELVLDINTFSQDAFTVSNPVSSQLFIKGDTSAVNQIVLYSVLGNKVLAQTINNTSGSINLNVSNLSKGIYIVEINGENGQRLTKKIIKK
ncbi:T9SS type A sorting domain-containing protein [uncultured Polaribacter sp.]|uniref:T9SS type A sorting domain-containing protein n=1 Tax=uncultured Polaribacter sp. TaxID=174711 RepID=UPI002638BEE4|nr:T9SS type A sorting domain-containing protein [uncultured Polaribacter sp.]